METRPAPQEAAQQTRKRLIPTPSTATIKRDMEGSGDKAHEEIGDPSLSSPRPAVKRKRKSAPSSRSDTATTPSTWASGGHDEEVGSYTRPLKKQKTASTATYYADEAAMQEVAGDEIEPYAPDGMKNSPTKAPSKPKKVYTDEEVKDFQDGVQNLNYWSSKTTCGKFVELIRWIDVEGLCIEDCGRQWVEKGYASKGKTKITNASMYKSYNCLAPVFYAEKGLMWMPIERRNAYNKKMRGYGLKTVGSPKKPRSTGIPLTPFASSSLMLATPLTPAFPDAFPEHSDSDLIVMSTHVRQNLKPQKKRRPKPKAMDTVPIPESDIAEVRLAREQDEKLEQLFLNQAGPTKRSSIIVPKGKTPTAHTLQPEIEVSAAEIGLFKIHRASEDVFSFKGEFGDVCRGHPSRPILRRELGAHHSTVLRNILKDDPTTDSIEYGDDIDASTITRFIACISPSVRSSLPTHDVAELTSDNEREFIGTQIQWSMQELKNLYMFAHRLGSADECDMVVDRWYEELHRPAKRMLRTEEGEIEGLDILSFSPAFLNYVCQHDKFVLDLFTDILIIKGEDGLRVLKAYGMSNWHNDVKSMLISKLESGDITAASKNDADTVCSAYHHHGAEHACYKSKVPIEPPVFDPELHGITVSKPFLKPKKRAVVAWNHKESPTQIKAQKKNRRDDNQPERHTLATKDDKREARVQKKLRKLYDDGESEQPSSSDSEDQKLNYHSIELDSEYRKTLELFKDAPTHYTYHTDAYTTVVPKPKMAKRTLNILVNKKGRPLYKDDSLNVANQRTSEADWKKMAIVLGKMQEFIDAGYSFVDIAIAVPEK